MNTIQQLKDELQQEYKTTKKFFTNYPEAHNEYAPHEKSMKMQPLANHISEVFAWPQLILNTEKLDFAAGDYIPQAAANKDELQKGLEANFQNGMAALNALQDEAALDNTWEICSGDQTFAKWSKYGAIRHALDQITHHRAQLGVYYRLNDIAVPGSYGPSADEQGFS